MANVYNSLTDLFKAIANSIRNKTGETSTIIADDFPVIINNIITLKDGSSDGTATANDMISGMTAYVDGIKVVGNIDFVTDNTEVVFTADIISTISDGLKFIVVNKSRICIDAGSRNSIKVTNENLASAIDLTPDKIIKGNTIAGIVGTATDDGTAIAKSIEVGKIAYSKGVKITGGLSFIDIISGTANIAINNSQSIVNFNIGYSDLSFPMNGNDSKGIIDKSTSGGLVELDASFANLASAIGLTADKIVKGTTILGIEGTAEVIVPNTEAKAWKQSNITDIYFGVLYYANGIWVAVGVAGSSSSKEQKGIWYSTDGKSWTQSNITAGNFYTLYYDNNIWVASSNNGTYNSTDGKNWTLVNEIQFRSIYYANGIWVAGCTGYNNKSRGIWYSTDGKSWAQSNISLTTNGFTTIQYANGIWVGVTNSASSSERNFYYSTDGKSWAQSNISTKGINFAYFVGNLWIAGSYSSQGLYYSSDGKSWVQSNITTDSFYTLYYAKGTYVAGSNYGIYYSYDGRNWEQSDLDNYQVPDIYYANNIWVAGCNMGMLRSEDGISWSYTNVSSGRFEKINYANGIWVAISSNGSGIWYSESTNS